MPNGGHQVSDIQVIVAVLWRGGAGGAGGMGGMGGMSTPPPMSMDPMSMDGSAKRGIARRGLPSGPGLDFKLDSPTDVTAEILNSAPRDRFDPTDPRAKDRRSSLQTLQPMPALPAHR
mmetsp:Transcript_56176/g.154916  ORF Transcript_56176/g.154916 Transcript_56176/m.154916 type:complete len:118 (+) Transcript_56176:1120-1473(+)